MSGLQAFGSWVSLVDCFCISTLAYTSLLIAGGAIPDSK